MRWDQEQPFPDKNASFFVIPLGHRRKFKKTVVLNSIARAVIEEQRGKNDEYVFTNGKDEQYTIYGTKHWAKAWKKAGMPTGPLISSGVDNLRRTFEYRLSVANVPSEVIDVLRGSTKAEIFERRVPVAIENLMDYVERITQRQETTILQAHGEQAKPKLGAWADGRTIRKETKPSASALEDAATFELTGPRRSCHPGSRGGLSISAPASAGRPVSALYLPERL